MTGHCPRGISDCNCGAAYCNRRKRRALMTLDEALAVILGPKIADDITVSHGRHWAVVAAMARATTDQSPEAISVIRAHVAQERRKMEQRQ